MHARRQPGDMPLKRLFTPSLRGILDVRPGLAYQNISSLRSNSGHRRASRGRSAAPVAACVRHRPTKEEMMTALNTAEPDITATDPPPARRAGAPRLALAL